MTSKLQIEANRRNARLSTGPKTERGRKVSRMNALSHGLTAEHVVLFDEALEDFQRYYREQMIALGPKGAVEARLAERIVLCAWLRRIYRIETGMFRKAATTWANGAPIRSEEVDVVFMRVSCHDNELAKLTRYERSLERSLEKALFSLERRQAIRKGHIEYRQVLLG